MKDNGSNDVGDGNGNDHMICGMYCNVIPTGNVAALEVRRDDVQWYDKGMCDTP